MICSSCGARITGVAWSTLGGPACVGCAIEAAQLAARPRFTPLWLPEPEMVSILRDVRRMEKMQAEMVASMTIPPEILGRMTVGTRTTVLGVDGVETVTHEAQWSYQR